MNIDAAIARMIEEEEDGFTLTPYVAPTPKPATPPAPKPTVKQMTEGDDAYMSVHRYIEAARRTGGDFEAESAARDVLFDLLDAVRSAHQLRR